MEIDIAQQLITPESAVVAQNFTARADQIANPLSLVANLQWTSRETGQKKKLTDRIEAGCEGRTEYIEITQWQCVIEYASGGERVCCARIGNDRETVVTWNGTHFERRLSYYSKCTECPTHQFHQIIARDVFDHAAAAVNEVAAVTDEANSDQDVAGGPLEKARRPGVRGPDKGAESRHPGAA